MESGAVVEVATSARCARSLPDDQRPSKGTRVFGDKRTGLCERRVLCGGLLVRQTCSSTPARLIHPHQDALDLSASCTTTCPTLAADCHRVPITHSTSNVLFTAVSHSLRGISPRQWAMKTR